MNASLMKMAFVQADVLYITLCILVANISQLQMSISKGDSVYIAIITFLLQNPVMMLVLSFDCIPHSVLPVNRRRYLFTLVASIVIAWWLVMLVFTWHERIEAKLFNRIIVVSDLYISAYGTFAIFCVKVALSAIINPKKLTVLTQNTSYVSLQSHMVLHAPDSSSPRDLESPIRYETATSSTGMNSANSSFQRMDSKRSPHHLSSSCGLSDSVSDIEGYTYYVDTAVERYLQRPMSSS